jgi:hypothetical protein
MTSTAHEARIHRISEGVVASYIHDISTPPAPPRIRRRPVRRDQAIETAASGVRFRKVNDASRYSVTSSASCAV